MYYTRIKYGSLNWPTRVCPVLGIGLLHWLHAPTTNFPCARSAVRRAEFCLEQRI